MKKNEKRAGKTKKVQRHIGIDLHTDCFTFCVLLEGAEPETRTHGRCRAAWSGSLKYFGLAMRLR